MQPEMRAKTVQDLIASGESQTLEFKRDFSSEVGKTICAFANTNSGTILFGVTDEGHVVGASERIEEKVASVAHTCKPSVYPQIRKEIFEGKLILVVEVPRSEGSLHSCGNIAYRRVGSTDRPLAPDEILREAAFVRAAKYDGQLCDAHLDDLDGEKIKAFLNRAKDVGRLDNGTAVDDVAGALDRLGVLEGGRVTNAAVLLFGKGPQQRLGQAEVRCARFKGNESIVFIDMKVIQGSVLDQVDRAEQFVMNHVKMAAEVKEFTRVERWEYPLGAVREAITNAVCHRDYTSSANVHVSIFDDWLEVWNPGSLPPPLTVASLRKPHRSIPRNPHIAQAMYMIRQIERWGTGIQRILKETTAHGLPEPELLEEQGGFKVVFRKVDAVLGRLSARQRKAWEYLQMHESISRREYATVCGCSASTGLRELQNMASLGLLKPEGTGKALVYKRLL